MTWKPCKLKVIWIHKDEKAPEELEQALNDAIEKEKRVRE